MLFAHHPNGGICLPNKASLLSRHQQRCLFPNASRLGFFDSNLTAGVKNIAYQIKKS